MGPVGRTKNGQPTLCVHVQPRGAKNRCSGLHGDALKLAVTAPPVDGRANKEIAEFLAEIFSVRRRSVVLHTGSQSRRKKFRFMSLSEEELRTRLAEILSSIG